MLFDQLFSLSSQAESGHETHFGYQSFYNAYRNGDFSLYQQDFEKNAEPHLKDLGKRQKALVI